MRLRKLSRPGLQLKLVGSFLGMTTLALLLQFLLLGGRLTSALAKLPRYGGDVAQEVPELLVGVLLLSAAVVLPLMFCLGVVMTHKIAGPVYRFEEYLGQIARGEKVGACRIRKGDELQELCRRLNSAIARLRREGGIEDEAYVSLEGVSIQGVELDDMPSPVAALRKSHELSSEDAGSETAASVTESSDVEDASSGSDHSA